MADDKETDAGNKGATKKRRFNLGEAGMEFLINNLESAQGRLRAAGYDTTGLSTLPASLRAKVKDAVKKNGWAIPVVETAITEGIRSLPMNDTLRDLVGPIIDLYFHGLRDVALEKDENKQRDSLQAAQLFLSSTLGDIQKRKPAKVAFDKLYLELMKEEDGALAADLDEWIPWMEKNAPAAYRLWTRFLENIRESKDTALPILKLVLAIKSADMTEKTHARLRRLGTIYANTFDIKDLARAIISGEPIPQLQHAEEKIASATADIKKFGEDMKARADRRLKQFS